MNKFIRRFHIILFIFLSHHGYSQIRFFAGGGANLTIGGVKDVQNIIHQYNQNYNSVLDSKMEFAGFPVGYTLEAGAMTRMLYFDVDYTQRKNMATSYVKDANGNISQTEVLKENNTIGFNAGIFIMPVGRFRIVMGGAYDFGGYTLSTRTYDKSNNAPPNFELAIQANERTRNVGGFLKFLIGNFKKSGFQLAIEPYYMYGINEISIDGLNKVLNPSTYENDPIRLTKNNYGGIKASLHIGINPLKGI